MECLACGDCCKRMSPISAPKECPYLEMIGDVAHCTVYEHRPDECANHCFQSRFCPIGASVLKLTDIEDIRARCQKVFETHKQVLWNPELLPKT